MDNNNSDLKPEWDESTVLSKNISENKGHIESVIEMLDNGATLPFIARYRKQATGDMPVDKLREVVVQLDELRTVRSRISNVYNVIKEQGKISEGLIVSLKHAKSVEDVEILYAPFKEGNKGSLAERAKAVGLELTAKAILDGMHVDLSTLLNPCKKGLSSLSDVEDGIRHIIAEVVSKDMKVVNEVKKLCATSCVCLESKKFKGTSKSNDKQMIGDVKRATKQESECKASLSIKHKNSNDQMSKFESYFDFSCSIHKIRPHQVLALNRGEELKILTVKVSIPENVRLQFQQFAYRHYIKPSFTVHCVAVIEKAILDSYSRLLLPQMCRHFRSEQTKIAEKASILVFCDNLRRLLFSPPVKGKIVLGVDPGFTNGCKCAVVSSTGDVLCTDVCYLHHYKSDRYKEQQKVISLVKTHQCDIVAIGNGVACRETEQVISDLICNQLHPLSIVYCIVDEGGASVYSISDEAQNELPDLDVTLRGAVSIARRFQDPLSEMVKIEPKHLGIGMYQHDIRKGKLQTALDSIVQECVSFTGVDINTASHCLLRHVAGLSSCRARNIIEWRAEHGHFVNRSQLLDVKGIGKKSFEQCAGFVRVMQSSQITARLTDTGQTVDDVIATGSRKRKAGSKAIWSGKRSKLAVHCGADVLDMTAIHPESYAVTERFILLQDLKKQDIGCDTFIERVKSISTANGAHEIATKLNVDTLTMQQIIDALSRPVSHDIRLDFQKPLFKKGMQFLSELKTDMILTGRVTNVVLFGAFVDLGVGINGLIHISKMRPPLKYAENLGLGDHVEVKICSVDAQRKRIALQLLRLLHL